MDETIELPGYVALLKRLYGYHHGIELALARADFPERPNAPHVDCRSIRLLEDLAAYISEDRHAAEMTSLNVFPINSYATFLGVLYVREGSMMGGRALAAKLDHLCGSHAFGRSFFHGSPDDGAAWHRLCRALDSLKDLEAQNQALDAALASFALFEAWMSPLEPFQAACVK
jgi:heme oxygenase